VSETAAIFFGAVLQVDRYTDAFDTYSENDPVAFGGVSLPLGGLRLSAGLALEFGNETDSRINAGFQIPLRR
jgi:hypothetical protein